MRCIYCNYGTKDNKPVSYHSDACPLASGQLDESKKIAFDAGYREGRAGRPRSNQEPDYRLGYLRGEAALESHENSCDRAIY